MKMIKNSIKLLGLFAVFCVATLQNKADAIKFADIPTPLNNSINSTINSSRSTLWRNVNWRFFTSSSNYTTWLKSYTKAAVKMWSTDIYFPFLKVEIDSNNLTVNIWGEDTKTYYAYVLPLNWLTYTFKNWETALLDNIFFWHDSIILYDDWFRHTLQYKWR